MCMVAELSDGKRAQTATNPGKSPANHDAPPRNHPHPTPPTVHQSS
ncbi:MAG: hypothetical protein LC777_15770 [Actinobacteria bacterium]|nr:hypothetical protein [Actinomycetota bacterium]